MIEIKETTAWEKLKTKVDLSQGFVKAVVDLKKNLFAVEAKNHSDIADYFKAAYHSEDIDLWGLRIHEDGSIEYNSLINKQNNYDHGYEQKSYGILNDEIRNEATRLVIEYIQGTHE